MQLNKHAFFNHGNGAGELHRLLCELRRAARYPRGRFPNHNSTDSPFPGYFPTPPTQPPPGADCSRIPSACANLISKPTEDALRGQSRTANFSANLGAVAPGDSATFVFNAALSQGASDTLAANSMWRTIQVVDLIGVLTSLDDIQITISVSGVFRGSYNGGIFSRSNANACTPACGITVCAGPLEPVVVIATNQTGAAFGATASAKLTVRTIYSGEPGFTCGADGSCSPVVQLAPPLYGGAPDCGCEGGE